MSQKIGVLIIHGIGNQKPNYADETIGLLKASLGEKSSNFYFESIFWARKVQERQNDFLNRLESYKLSWKFLRNFVVSFLGDAVAYQSRTNLPIQTYEEVHAVIHSHVINLKNKLGIHGSETYPLVLFAHSLGCTMITDYVWDRQQNEKKSKLDPYGNSEFERMHSLTGIITFGCNLPLFNLSYDDIKSIEFPPLHLNEDLKQKSKWINIYSKYDLLGFPLKPIGPAYVNLSKLEDKEMNVGNILPDFTPFSHNKYWYDRRFINKVSRYLESLI